MSIRPKSLRSLHRTMVEVRVTSFPLHHTTSEGGDARRIEFVSIAHARLASSKVNAHRRRRRRNFPAPQTFAHRHRHQVAIFLVVRRDGHADRRDSAPAGRPVTTLYLLKRQSGFAFLVLSRPSYITWCRCANGHAPMFHHMFTLPPPLYLVKTRQLETFSGESLNNVVALTHAVLTNCWCLLDNEQIQIQMGICRARLTNCPGALTKCLRLFVKIIIFTIISLRPFDSQKPSEIAVLCVYFCSSLLRLLRVFYWLQYWQANSARCSSQLNWKFYFLIKCNSTWRYLYGAER